MTWGSKEMSPARIGARNGILTLCLHRGISLAGNRRSWVIRHRFPFGLRKLVADFLAA